ncbi:COP9 signalosome complex subunit 1 [Fukomys damarensis]|uniref:COP9 signalosome complex subunit 1 n=1 Tax=Fukomys damarensis TaxID=885580 RepID=A0A091DT24_FUKDA|nr:COP9 signalosome complex subunit 1 [Fukomys damarensis]
MLEKLDIDLKNYKGNSIKENIRCDHAYLGDHYLECGDLRNALKCYFLPETTALAPSTSSTCASVIKQFLQVIPRAGASGLRHHLQILRVQVRFVPEDAGQDEGQPALGHVPGSPLQDPVHPESQSVFLPLCEGPTCTRWAQPFNTTVAALQEELTEIILEGFINTSIDSHSKILYPRDVDQCSTTFEKSLLIIKEFQRWAKAMTLRAAALRNQIHAKSPPREGSQGELTRETASPV